MYHNFVFQDATEALPKLFHSLLVDGDEITSRAGVTKELTHVGITLTHPWRREILCQERKPNIAAQIAEAAWVLAGRDDIAWLGEYLPRVWDFSDDGEVWRAGYGKRLRHWAGNDREVDQLAYIIETLKASHASRQAVMNIWSPTLDTLPGKDIPCNNWLSFSSRLGKLDLMVAIRSNDAMWGWSGINAFEWSVLQEVVAGILGLGVGGLHFATTSFHLYDQHWEKARRVSLAAPVTRVYKDSPRFDASDLVYRDVESLDKLLDRFFVVEHLIRVGSEVAHAYVEDFPEPMFRSWLQVLEWWWSGDTRYLKDLEGTALHLATQMSVQPKVNGRPAPAPEVQEFIADGQVVKTVTDQDCSEFLGEVFRLHREKHAAYGDSWKRRGEMLGIMANIARKIDRLGGAETADETAADTAIDLMVYLAKYRVWLSDFAMGTKRSDDPEPANDLMHETEVRWLFNAMPIKPELLEDALRSNFDKLEQMVVNHDMLRTRLVDEMLADAYVLALGRWESVQS